MLSQVGPVADLQLRHELADIRLRVFRFLIENALTVALCVLPLAVLQEQGRAAQQGRCGICRTCNGFCAENFFDPADQVLHEPKPRHVERLQVRKFLRQIIRVHVPIRRNQNLLFSVLDECQKARPFVAHPDGREIFRPGAKYDHNFGAVEGGEDVRLVFRAELVLQRDAREENLEALLRQLVIEVICQHRVHGAFAIVIGFLITDEHVERIFPLGDRQIALLNGFDCFSLGNIDRFLLVISIPERGQIVRILQDRAESHAVDRRHALMACRIFDVFNSVAAQN